MSFTESSHLDAKNRASTISSNEGIQTLDSGTSPEGQKKKVMAFGTFDLFHPGHVYYLSEAETHGEKLIVIIARDERVKSIKKLVPHDDEDIRLANVAHAFRNAEVILGDETDIFAPLYAYNPDVLAFGYDQRVPEEKIRELFPSIEIVRIGGYDTDKWKSSILRSEKKEKADNTL